MCPLFLFASWVGFLVPRMNSRKIMASWGHIWFILLHCEKKSPRKCSLENNIFWDWKPEMRTSQKLWRSWQFKCRWNQIEEENKILAHRIFLTSRTRPYKLEGKAVVQEIPEGGEGMKTNEVFFFFFKI